MCWSLHSRHYASLPLVTVPLSLSLPLCIVAAASLCSCQGMPSSRLYTGIITGQLYSDRSAFWLQVSVAVKADTVYAKVSTNLPASQNCHCSL